MRPLPLAILSIAAWISSPATSPAQSPTHDFGAGPLPRKLIAAGWDSPSPALFLANLREIEKTPFSGVRIQIEPKEVDGVRVNLRALFNATPWKKEWFQKEVDDLKKACSEKLTDNFLSIGAGPALDWYDDAGWEAVLEHFRIAAWIAREGGLKGLMFDPEIGGAQPAFSYLRQAGRAKYGFVEYSAKVRERGRRVMEVLKEEFPEMTLFTLFLNSGTAMGGLGADPRDGLEGMRNYSLLPAFLNGWLDAIPPTMTVVDGAEYAYPHSSELQYLKHVNAIRNTTLALIAPENHVKYRAQVQAALAIYLDAFIRHPMDDIHSDVVKDPPLKGRLIERFQEALFSAREISDQYVWVWGEQYRWWPTEAKRVRPQRWEHILPGVSEALRNALDPEKAALARAAREFGIQQRKMALGGRALKNLIENGVFAVQRKGEEELPGWTVEPPGGAGALLGCDPMFGYGSRGCARLEAASEAALSQEVEVTPYRFYKARAKVRQMGEGRPEVRLHWIEADPNGGAGKRVLGQKLTPAASPREGWQPVGTVVRVPAGSTRLVVELAALGQKSPDDVIWFDDVELIPISVN